MFFILQNLIHWFWYYQNLLFFNYYHSDSRWHTNRACNTEEWGTIPWHYA